MKTIAVFFGSNSAEHDVSIITALVGVIAPLSAVGEYQIEPVYIAKDGSWHWDDRLKDISLYTSGKIEEFLKNDQPVQVSFDGGMTLSKVSGRLNRKKSVRIDVAFPATHGTYGEDGSLMGVFRMAGIPFVGCDMEASVIAMNKLLSHQVVSAAGIPGYRYLGLQKKAFETNTDDALKLFKDFRYPLFVKPVHLGSSIGISKVTNIAELHNALEVAFHYDDTAIVEEAVSNLIEVTLPIIDGDDGPQAALLESPLIDEGGTFDFNTKYMKQGKGGKKAGGNATGAQGYSELPAKLPKELYSKAEKLGLDVYRVIGCSGIARVDMLIDSLKKEVYFNEINPLPGSLYAHNWRMAGIATVDLVKKLIEQAERRAKLQRRIVTTFSTNFLKQF